MKKGDKCKVQIRLPTFDKTTGSQIFTNTKFPVPVYKTIETEGEIIKIVSKEEELYNVTIKHDKGKINLREKDVELIQKTFCF